MIIALLVIVYMLGVIKICQAMKEIKRLENNYMCNTIDKIYQECIKEIDDGK